MSLIGHVLSDALHDVFWDIAKKSIKFRKNFKIYKAVESLRASDFGIYTYHPFYLTRQSDKEIEKSLRDNKIVFIAGMSNIGKTRSAYEIAKSLLGWYLLKPHYKRIDISSLKFPSFFWTKKVILLLDDLEKYIGRLDADRLICALEQKSQELVVIATCRRSKEFELMFVQRGMVKLLSQCRVHKIEPTKLKEEQEKDLAKYVQKKCKDVTANGTPGSIVLDLEQMRRKYIELKDEPKTILHALKLLREANICLCTKRLVKSITKSKIFNLKVNMFRWYSWIRTLQENQFIKMSRGQILVWHDSYLDDNFMTDFKISDKVLVQLKEELSNLYEAENLRYLGINFLERKNLKECIDCYKSVLKIDPFSAEAHKDLADLFYELKRCAEAEREYREALRIDPDDAEMHRNFGNLLTALGKYSDARKEYKKALKINPDDIEASYGLNIVLENLESFLEAEKRGKKILRFNPDYAEAHCNLGIVLHALKRYSEAEKEYREAIRINPKDAEAHNNLGSLFYFLKRYSDAEKEYREAIKINPPYAETHCNLGILLHDLRAYSEAEKEYREAIRISPDYAEAHNNLAVLLYDLHRYAEAYEKQEKARILFEKEQRMVKEFLKKLKTE